MDAGVMVHYHTQKKIIIIFSSSCDNQPLNIHNTISNMICVKVSSVFLTKKQAGLCCHRIVH